MRAIAFGLLLTAYFPATAAPPPKLDEKLLRAAFEKTLKDSESARFRNIQYQETEVPGGWTMCGEFNAKNSYGGYVGFQPFLGMAVKEDKKPLHYIVLSTGEGGAAVCRQRGLLQ